MYITIAGIKRSGSTWQANLIRIICEEHNLTTWMGELYSIDEVPGFDVTINKIHPFNAEIAERSDFVFTSWRPLRAIRRSWWRFQHEDLSPQLEEQWLTSIMLWQMSSNYLMPFKAIETDPQQVLVDINHIIFGLDTMQPFADRILERMRLEVVPPTDKMYDPKTCLFHNHITSKR